MAKGTRRKPWSGLDRARQRERTVFGDAAIAIGGGKFKGTDSSGKPMDSHVRFTDTWVKMPDGKWQCVATHDSTIKM